MVIEESPPGPRLPRRGPDPDFQGNEEAIRIVVEAAA